MFRVLSSFTGAGGLDLGFHGNFTYLGKKFPALDFKTIKAVEYNLDACKTLLYNKKYFNDINVINKDITLLNPYSLFKGEEFDVFLGGFPCVTFSIVGKQTGVKDDINGKLYESFASFVEATKPKVFLAENVKGILSANKGEAIKIIQKRFEDTGYKIKYFLVNFADYGVPQLRQRVIFVGIRNDLKGDFQIPEPSHLAKHLTSFDAFQNIPATCPNNIIMKQNDLTIQRIAAIPEGGNHKDLPEHLSIKAQMSNIYRRLDRKKPAYTVMASGGGGTWTYHYQEPRALTNRERARLQGFPDDHIFQGTNTEIRRQIGNAVPPVGIYPFAKEIQRILKLNL